MDILCGITKSLCYSGNSPQVFLILSKGSLMPFFKKNFHFAVQACAGHKIQLNIPVGKGCKEVKEGIIRLI